MSSKNAKSQSDLSTAPVDIRAGENPRMLPNGAEVLSPVSRTVAAYLPTMGERIRRYTRSSELQRDAYLDPEYWDDEDVEEFFHEGELRRNISKHEERYAFALEKAKKKKADRDEAKRLEAIEAEKTRKEERRKELQELLKEGSTE